VSVDGEHPSERHVAGSRVRVQPVPGPLEEQQQGIHRRAGLHAHRRGAPRQQLDRRQVLRGVHQHKRLVAGLTLGDGQR
jgi:hypothetical protein